ncbi:MAG TPA: hypothetical protein VFG83_02415 [Kofleriaceae bacterium]|nr:hypothetical protein [Kofleriaceae bacterium]
MKRFALSSLAGVLALAATAVPALAQATATDSSATTEKKAKSFDFTGDTIDGDLIKPDGDFINPRDFANHTSLIKVRTDFIKEILQSAEQV